MDKAETYEGIKPDSELDSTISNKLLLNDDRYEELIRGSPKLGS